MSSRYYVKGGTPFTYVPVQTVEDAGDLGTEMARDGHYPPGMSACFVAGINGDAADGCPFAGTSDCTCEADQ